MHSYLWWKRETFWESKKPSAVWLMIKWWWSCQHTPASITYSDAHRMQHYVMIYKVTIAFMMIYNKNLLREVQPQRLKICNRSQDLLKGQPLVYTWYFHRVGACWTKWGVHSCQTLTFRRVKDIFMKQSGQNSLHVQSCIKYYLEQESWLFFFLLFMKSESWCNENNKSNSHNQKIKLLREDNAIRILI